MGENWETFGELLAQTRLPRNEFDVVGEAGSAARKDGMTSKILALTDALGNLVRFVILPRQRFDTVGVPPLIEGSAFDALIADKAFDGNAITAELDARGAKAVIS